MIKPEQLVVGMRYVHWGVEVVVEYAQPFGRGANSSPDPTIKIRRMDGTSTLTTFSAFMSATPVSTSAPTAAATPEDAAPKSLGQVACEAYEAGMVPGSIWERAWERVAAAVVEQFCERLLDKGAVERGAEELFRDAWGEKDHAGRFAWRTDIERALRAAIEKARETP